MLLNRFSPAKEKNATTTGLLTGGAITINVGDNATFDIEAGTGQVVDMTDPANPVVTDVAWSASSAVAVTDIATEAFSWAGMSAAGTVLQISGTFPTPEESRQFIWLGLLGHPSNSFIDGIESRPFSAVSPAMAGADLIRAIGPFNISGNEYSANGANLLLNRSAGRTFNFGIGFNADPEKPHEVTLSSSSPVFFYTYRDGVGGWVLTAPQAPIDPTLYDDGSGTLAAVPANRWTIHRIIMAGNGDTIIYRGQVLYNSRSNAEAAIHDVVDQEPAYAEFIHRGEIVVRGNTTDLSDAANNTFFVSPSGIGGAQSTGSVGVSNHDQLGNITADDHIVINTTTVKATPTSADLLLIEDVADSNAKKSITIGDLLALVTAGLGFHLVFGAAFSGTDDGDFAVVNGRPDSGEIGVLAERTRYTVLVDSTITEFSYDTQSGDTDTVWKIIVDGSEEATITQTAAAGTQTLASPIAVLAGDQVAIEMDAAIAAPNRCNVGIYFE